MAEVFEGREFPAEEAAPVKLFNKITTFRVDWPIYRYYYQRIQTNKRRLTMMFTHNIDIGGMELEIHFSYVPAEPQTYDHPGYPEELEITGIFPAGTTHEWTTYFNDETMDYFLQQIKGDEK